VQRRVVNVLQAIAKSRAAEPCRVDSRLRIGGKTTELLPWSAEYYITFIWFRLQKWSHHYLDTLFFSPSIFCKFLGTRIKHCKRCKSGPLVINSSRSGCPNAPPAPTTRTERDMRLGTRLDIREYPPALCLPWRSRWLLWLDDGDYRERRSCKSRHILISRVG
jgi:hypothetical protein